MNRKKTREDKASAILDCALNLLKENGDSGLTMRKIADGMEMRLSNVQYYFKSRDDVLKAMVARYSMMCIEDIQLLVRENPERTVRDRARLLIMSGLRHGDELSDMCRIFRELWAISSRNLIIRDHMVDYYRIFSSVIADFVLGDDADPTAKDRVKSLLLPFFEGYSVTAASVPLATDRVGELLTEIVVSVSSSDHSPV